MRKLLIIKNKQVKKNSTLLQYHYFTLIYLWVILHAQLGYIYLLYDLSSNSFHSDFLKSLCWPQFTFLHDGHHHTFFSFCCYYFVFLEKENFHFRFWSLGKPLPMFQNGILSSCPRLDLPLISIINKFIIEISEICSWID